MRAFSVFNAFDFCLTDQFRSPVDIFCPYSIVDVVAYGYLMTTFLFLDFSYASVTYFSSLCFWERFLWLMRFVESFCLTGWEIWCMDHLFYGRKLQFWDLTWLLMIDHLTFRLVRFSRFKSNLMRQKFIADYFCHLFDQNWTDFALKQACFIE
jgi:hypothetical protein